MTLDQMKIPDLAMPVALIIREKVARPDRLPTEFCGSLRWEGWNGNPKDNCCPMGLIPGALISIPYVFRHLPGYNLTDDNVGYFCEWWDNVLIGFEQSVTHDEIAKRAMDLIWGTDGA